MDSCKDAGQFRCGRAFHVGYLQGKPLHYGNCEHKVASSDAAVAYFDSSSKDVDLLQKASSVCGHQHEASSVLDTTGSCDQFQTGPSSSEPCQKPSAPTAQTPWSSVCMDSTMLRHWQEDQTVWPPPPPPKGKPPPVYATSQLHPNTSWKFAADGSSSGASTSAVELWAGVDSTDEVSDICTSSHTGTSCSVFSSMPPMSASHALQQQVRLRCARPNCQYLVHSTNDFGQFCCGTCWCRHTGIGRGGSAHSEFCEQQEASYGSPAATYDPNLNELELIHRTRTQQHSSMTSSWAQCAQCQDALPNEQHHRAFWTSADPPRPMPV